MQALVRGAHRLVCATISVFAFFGVLSAANAKTPMISFSRARVADSGVVDTTRRTRTLDFSVSTGTWMSVDVSPDGNTLVFDLLGDLYTMPVTGGTATRITSGPAYDAQPKFSPDGRRIVFVSDRDGSDGIWVVNTDGSQPHLFMQGTYVAPMWCPDNECVVASKSDGIMLYPLTGGSGTRLGPGARAVFSRDARYVYLSERAGAQPWDQKSVRVYDRATGRTTTITANAVAAVVTSDRRSMVVAQPQGNSSVFRVVDLATGASRWLPIEGLPLNSTDVTRDALPGAAITPDDKTLITWMQGALWRIDLATGRRQAIPFQANVRQESGIVQRPADRVADSIVSVRAIKEVRLSPDGAHIVFVALGKIWIRDAASGTPRRLTTGTDDEYAPAWSPDGKYVAFATWGRDDGSISRVASTGGVVERMSQTPGAYDQLSYSSDGRKILALRTPVQDVREATVARSTNGVELVWIPASGGVSTSIAAYDRPVSPTLTGRPHTTRDTSRVYVMMPSEGLISMRWDGSDSRRVAKAEGADDIVMSPDGERVLVVGKDGITLVSAPEDGDTSLVITMNAPSDPKRMPIKIAQAGANSAAWSPDAKSIVYAADLSVFTYDVARTDSLAADSVRAVLRGQPRKPSTSVPAIRHDVALTIPVDVPHGTIVLRGARVVTMRGAERDTERDTERGADIIPDGDVVVDGNRIVAVGARGQVTVPMGATIVDVSGKTIIPGYVDLWATTQPMSGAHGAPWEYAANLAYGVTTIREVGPLSSVLDVTARVEAGDWPGPRSARALQKEKAPAEVGALRHAAMTVHDGVGEYLHTIPIMALGDDMIQSFVRGGVTYVPALLSGDGGAPAADYYWERPGLHADPKLARFIPHVVLDQQTLHRSGWLRDDFYPFKKYAEDATRLVHAGGHVAVGTRGVLPGLGVHWELWSLTAGGMSPLEVLRAGTIWGAEVLGQSTELGVVAPGALADLQILDRNPLDDIHNTTSLRYVMKNGRLYEASSLDEIAPHKHSNPTPWWIEHDPVLPLTAAMPAE